MLPVSLEHSGSNREVKLVVTDICKHLGSLMSIDGLFAPEAHARVSSAMASFAPLSVAVLGAQSVDQARRIRLGWSLVVSRLCYNMHIWSHFPYHIWRIVNTMYNRLWRRVYGQPRFGRTECSDYQVRTALGVPSLDCLVRKRRLKYLSRLAAVDLPALHALLQATDGKGSRMPWVALLLDDLSVIRNALPRILGSLPPPLVDATQYWNIASEFPQEWAEIVSNYFTCSDDPGRSRLPSLAPPSAVTFQCELCTHAPFASGKALAQHQRISHGQRTAVSMFVGDWRACPVCFTIFASRLHLVSHLADKRVRSKTRGTNCGMIFIARNPSCIDSAVLSSLFAAEKVARQQARKQGHTRPTVESAAKRGTPSCLKGWSARRSKLALLPRKRLSVKTDPRATASCVRCVGSAGPPAECQANRPCQHAQCLEGVSSLLPVKRLWAKTTPIEGISFKKHHGVNQDD